MKDTITPQLCHLLPQKEEKDVKDYVLTGLIEVTMRVRAESRSEAVRWMERVIVYLEDDNGNPIDLAQFDGIVEEFYGEPLGEVSVH